VLRYLQFNSNRKLSELIGVITCPGHLTKAEQNHLNRRENRISKSIYKDKHN
jgi:hypothetical protein